MEQNNDEGKSPIHLAKGLFSNCHLSKSAFKLTYGKIMLQEKEWQLSHTSFL